MKGEQIEQGNAAQASARILAEFWPRLAGAQQPLLMLDYDGTLAPFTPDRLHAWPYPGVGEALAALAGTPTRIVVVTGRESRDVVRLLPEAGQLEIWGCHGLERRDCHGICRYAELSSETRAALAEAARLAEDQALGDQLEVKPGCVALHHRGLPPASAAEVQRMAQVLWQHLVGQHGMNLRPFDGGVELRSELANKARAVREILAEDAGSDVIAYLGDDETDEDAFAALPEGSLTVLVRKEWRVTRATAWLKPPRELIEFISRWGSTVRAGQRQLGAVAS